MLYFAYGANLERRAMQRRCPRARPLCVGTVAGYRLVFRRYADIIADSSATVWGALYEITPACEKALDAFEGFPGLYRKQTLDVETEDGPRRAMAYVMAGGNLAPPDAAYYGGIARGYRDWKLDEALLRKARFSTLQPARPQRGPGEPLTPPPAGAAGRR